MLGTNVGSDIAQQSLLIGIVALAGALTFTRTLLYRDFGIMIGVAALVLAFGWNGRLSRAEGAWLTAGYVVYLGVVYRSRSRDETTGAGPAPEVEPESSPWRHWSFILGGLVAIVIAGHLLLQAVENLVQGLGLGGSLIGVAVIGLATSLPELSAALASIRKGQSELSVGTLVGSNITNPMLALGVGMLISGYHVPNVVLEFDLPVKIGTAMVVFALLLSGRRLSKLESVISIGLYVTYLAARMWLFQDDSDFDRRERSARREAVVSETSAGTRFPRAGHSGYSRCLAVLERQLAEDSYLPSLGTARSEELDGERRRPSVERTRPLQEAELKEAPERLHLSQDAGGVGTWEWDVRDDSLESSHVNCRLLGLDPEDTLNYGRWMERIHAEDRAEVEGTLRRAVSSAGPCEAEFRVSLPDGSERWLWLKGKVELDERGAPARVVGVHIDVSSRKQRELERENAAARSRRASALKDDFLAMLGHELRNPIGAIANGIALLRSDDGPDHRKWAEEMIERQTQNLKRLVDDILEVSRITRGQIEIRPEIVSISSCVEAARDAVRERIQESELHLEVRFPGEPVHLFVDPARMGQILGNLLANAIKHTDRGGHIELTAERHHDKLHVRVADDGEGMTEDQMKVVFEPFVRVNSSLHRAGSGLGIGLTVAKNLAELHGGSLTVQSDGPGMGCAFTVELPVHEGEVVADANASSRARSSLRILIIDDNKDLALGLKKRLEGQGHEVVLAHDGPQGIAKARETGPQIVLVDVGLPSMDGYQVAGKLREEASPRTRIAGISGFKERGEEDVAANVFDHYFLKPVDAEQLNAWLARVSRGLEEDEEGRDTA